MQKFLSEFRDFAMKGNVVDLAIGVVIGAAFGKIVDSIVNDIFMPIIGFITGGIDFSNHYIALSDKVKDGMAYDDAQKAGAVIGWGHFVTVLVSFLIIAWVLFLVVKGINRLRAQAAAKAEAAPPPGPTKEEVLLTQIRDILAKQAA
jgi:large conductance mechanosensitive channel